MRISDWSSDVCSSDLNTTVTGSGDVGIQLASNATFIGFGNVQSIPAAGLRAFVATNNTGTIRSSSGSFVSTGNAAVTITGPGGQIGRASCRERVCQYV